MDFLTHLFDTSDFPPRWHCGQWSDAHGYLHIVSDLGIWSAYFAIPCTLGYFVLRQKDWPFRSIVLLFVSFILLCGTTHLMEAAIFWWPAYRLAGLIKFLTAVVSWTTVAALVYVAPRALAMRSPEALQREIERRVAAEEGLLRAKAELEDRVQARTAELKQSESRFVQLADAIPQLAWMARPDGHIDWYNSRWYEYTGTSFEQMEGWGWRSVHDPATLPSVIERWQASLDSGEPLDMVFPLRSAAGEFHPFLTRVMPFREDDGKIVRWFGTNTDISELQQAQEELRQVAAQLSEADRRKNNFLATLAHELRNPLAPIRTGLEVMKLSQDDPARIEEVRQMMERQTRQLIALVDDLLDASRITRGRLELRKCRVKLADVVQSAVEASRPAIDDAGHQLSVKLPDETVELEADPHRLAQVISNLLNNAAKYTPDGGRIDLSIEQSEREAVISVRDTGIGIAAGMQNRIFEMFAQVDHPIDKEYTGLGIGLTLVKLLVEMHGGQVEVKSAGTNQGSEFIVRIPILPPSAPAPPKSAPPAETSEARQRVLIVDDNLAAANMLSMVVRLLGHDVQTADDGARALELAAEFRPDIVLMDLGMPRMNGYEAARHMRKQPWGQSLVLVALTGWGQEEDKQRTREAGFDRHLVKPADPAELKQLLAQAGRARPSPS